VVAPDFFRRFAVGRVVVEVPAGEVHPPRLAAIEALLAHDELVGAHALFLVAVSRDLPVSAELGRSYIGVGVISRAL
jgi:hypothetical protein